MRTQEAMAALTGGHVVDVHAAIRVPKAPEGRGGGGTTPLSRTERQVTLG
jgi:hypothetical protein